MKLKRAVAILGSCMIILVIFMIYSAKDLSGFPSRKSSILQDFQDNKLLHFEDKIKQLEVNLNKHQDDVYEIKAAMKNILRPPANVNSQMNRHVPSNLDVPRTNYLAISEVRYNSSCSIQVKVAPRTDVQMLELYKVLNFDNPDGGVWKQGWRIEVDEKDWNRHNKLKVFVVPHSHNDPGWIKTVEEYYATQTKHILDNMLNKLPEDPRRKFIWAEISYFSMWWADLDEDDREKVKRLLKNNQLEIVTGGWVMNDEANSHWMSIMYQLTEGHQWLQKNLNYTPVSHWSIDAFGLSLTQPVLLKNMGLQNMLIQRVHYSVKKHLASQRQLEFRWRQLWDGTGNTDMFTHMMPFYSYDVPHTCGPDPKICCQFDFKRLQNHGFHCPWRVPPQVITDHNVAERAQLLLDQYRKKSKLFKTNVVLAPLGDDFRYDHPTEWDVQYSNYQRLFDYLNSNLQLNVKAQFGTLSDYFAEVRKEKEMADFPVLSGDFFTYADRDDHYWSGYYTSRPFYKRMDRILLSYVRAAESILALTHLNSNKISSWLKDSKNGLETILTNARQSLSLFQHHDGITGTAKDHVVIDYARKMLRAISGCQKVIQLCTHIMLNGVDNELPNKDTSYYNVDDVRHSHDALPEHYQITIGVPEMTTKKVAIYNSLTSARHEVVTFHVSTPFIEVTDFHGKRIICQVSPIFEHASSMSLTKYRLSFVVDIPPLAVVSYKVKALFESEVPRETVYSNVKIFNHYGVIQSPNGFQPEVSASSSEFTLHNEILTASFSSIGLLKSLRVGTTTVPVHLDFARYGVRMKANSERSGAYLFLPDGEAVPIQTENVIVNLIEGPVLSSVFVQLPYVQHSVSIYNSTGADSLGIEIENTVDIEKTNNFELVMRLSTNINSFDEFFTDVNGYQIMRRKCFKKLPLQANYYPMPATAYIEDKNMRLTVTSSSPLGCSSLSAGQIEVMLDRRLSQDDNLGLGQGVFDNHPTRHNFRILLEKKNPSCQAATENHPAGFPTVSAHVASQSLLNPLIRMIKCDDDDDDNTMEGVYTSTKEEVGVDILMPSLRSNIHVKGSSHLGAVIYRQFLDVCFADESVLQRFPLSDGTLNISSLLPLDAKKKVYETALSFTSVRKEINWRENLQLCPMDMRAYIFSENT
ncbi:unnamed protein product [Phaedon cochleariae]|uniref:Alpha-mannosidase n=1 Tax=Phaedon cochleariae TaxID=80249 RepID=A0A9N9X2R1_PHACE|nr:unnamed protein product [Phaedon cochleariae]